MNRHILVAIDGSEVSKNAFEYTLSEYPDEAITALHVIESANPFLSIGFSFDSYSEIPSHEYESAEKLLEERTEEVEGDIEIQTAIETGKVAQEIVEYSEKNDVDHIIIGSHGRERTSRILLGSVAEAVARRSPVPITIVR